MPYLDVILQALACSEEQYSRLKPSGFIALQIIPLSKQPFEMQPQIENEEVTWSPQYNLPTTRINKHRALPLKEVELDGWILIPHIALKAHTL
jgi:hypothetical protein